MEYTKKIIESSFDYIYETGDINNIDENLRYSVDNVLSLIDSGKLRVSEKIENHWITHQWLKKAILLAFILYKNDIISVGNFKFFDKFSSKFEKWKKKEFQKKNIRISPFANIRYGSYVAKNTILMPCYINLGAYIDEGTMIDTWATVGSCAQIGKNVHLSGGVGIGGVIEPLQDHPTIIEDNCFIGARSEIVEGSIVEEGSIIATGVFISKSTKIFDRNTKKIYYGRIPAGSVVVSGSLPSKDNSHHIYCAVIVKKVDYNSAKKTSINKILRNLNQLD